MSFAEETNHLVIVGGSSMAAVNWEQVFPGKHVFPALVDDFSTHQLGWIFDDLVMPHAPGMCLYQGGLVDALLDVPPDAVAHTVKTQIGQLREGGFRVLVIGLPDPQNGAGQPGTRIRRINTVLAESAREMDCGFVSLAKRGSTGGVDGPPVHPAPEVAIRLTTAFANRPQADREIPSTRELAADRIDRIRKASPPAVGIVMLGDSITENGGDWSKRLEREDVLNCGQGGYATGQIQWLLEPCVLSTDAQACFIMGGLNDLSLGFSVGSIAANIESIAKVLDGAGIRPVIQSILFPRNSPEAMTQITELNQGLRRFCRDNGYSYLELNDHLCDENGLLPELTTDGAHLTEAGYEKWSERLKAFLRANNL